MIRATERLLAAALVLGAVLLVAAPVSAATITVTADITVSETWTADNEYILDKPIYVTNGATLTIEAGTVVRGDPQSVVGANDPGTLIITRDSKIRALGEQLRPITFTDLFDDNVGSNPGSFPYDNLLDATALTGQWGGVILLGRSYVANNTLAAPDPTREFQIEGLTAIGGLGLYGNCAADLVAPFCDDDDSGYLKYVSIRYGGFNLSANNEINGLTLGAVGRETDIDYIEIFNNKDDGIEFFGGTVPVRHAIVANVGDDSVDYDEGYRGKLQFVFAMQGLPGPDKSDKGAEQDGGNAPDGSLPKAIPTIYNATVVGHGQKATYTAKLTNTGLHFRDNAGGRWYNSFLADFGGATLCIEGGATTSTDPNTSGARSITPYVIDGTFYLPPASTYELELEDNTFWCFGFQGPVTGFNTGATYGCDASKWHHDPGVFTNAALENSYLGCAEPLPIRELTRDPNPDPAVPDAIVSIDPRPTAASPLLTTNRIAPTDGFFQPAPYRGAFAADRNWAEGWSTLSRLGYFPPKPEVLVASDIAVSTTWNADNVYVLDKPIYVTSGATLTIAPGTVVRGQPQSIVGANDPGTIIIARDSKIQALGTKEQPIVFTDLFDDNVGGYPGTVPYDNALDALSLTGQWGGVILLGRTYVANNTLAAPDPAREFQIEGLTAVGGLGLYGNCAADLVSPLCDDDDSGRMQYVSIRYGGFNLSANNEINGLTLGAVGRSTGLDYIEIANNKDDGVEFFGGTVQPRHLAILNVGDDSIDYDEGFRGRVQYAFVMQGTPGPDKSDKGAEQDGGNAPDGSLPRAIPTISNVTAIGLGQKATYTAKLTNTGLHFRDNAGGRWYNSVLADFGGATLCIEGGATTSTDPNTSGERSITTYVTDGQFYVEPVVPTGTQLELRNNSFWCFGFQGPVTGFNTGATYGCDASKWHHDPGVFTNAALGNTFGLCTDPLPIRQLTRTNSGDVLIPDPIVAVDPRAVPAVTTETCLGGGAAWWDGSKWQCPPYRGAFGPYENWLNCWSTACRLGYFPTCGASNPTAVPNEPSNLRFVTKTDLSWDAVDRNITAYNVIRSATASNFSTATVVQSDLDTTATDATIPAAGTAAYYLVGAVNDCGQAYGIRSDGSARTTP